MPTLNLSIIVDNYSVRLQYLLKLNRVLSHIHIVFRALYTTPVMINFTLISVDEAYTGLEILCLV